MNMEKSKEIEALISIYRPNQINAVFVGMASAMLTDEQADEMIRILNKWIGEEN